jgi:DNA polymerase-3 subunit alpha
LQNSVEIAKRCNLTLTLGKPQLPNFPTPGMTIDEFLVAETQGPGRAPGAAVSRPGQARAEPRPLRGAPEFENNTIIKMKFPGYFLIVADFIQWAKNNGVPVGPGRGSGAGSLVAYA